MRVAEGVREFLLSASPQFFAQLQTATEADPWKIGFAIVHKIDNVVMGMCGFAAPPDSDGTVESAMALRRVIRAKATPAKLLKRWSISHRTTRQ